MPNKRTILDIHGNVFFMAQIPQDGMSTKTQHTTIHHHHGATGATSAVLPHWSSFYMSGEDMCSFWGHAGHCGLKNINITTRGVSCNMAVKQKKNTIFFMS